MFNPEYIKESGQNSGIGLSLTNEKIFLFYIKSGKTQRFQLNEFIWKLYNLNKFGKLEAEYFLDAISELDELYSDYNEYLQLKEETRRKHKAKHGTGIRNSR